MIAIVLLAMVSAALLLLTRQLGFEFQRTRQATEDAQLRQLLLAGAQDAVARAKEWHADAPPPGWSLELPRELADGGASVSFEVGAAKDDWREVVVVARMGGREAVQTLTFTRTGDAWKVSSAALPG